MKTWVLCHCSGQQRGALSESLLNAEFLLVPTQSPRHRASLGTSPNSLTMSGNSAACLDQGTSVQLTGKQLEQLQSCRAGRATCSWKHPVPSSPAPSEQERHQHQRATCLQHPKTPWTSNYKHCLLTSTLPLKTHICTGTNRASQAIASPEAQAARTLGFWTQSMQHRHLQGSLEQKQSPSYWGGSNAEEPQSRAKSSPSSTALTAEPTAKAGSAPAGMQGLTGTTPRAPGRGEQKLRQV